MIPGHANLKSKDAIVDRILSRKTAPDSGPRKQARNLRILERKPARLHRHFRRTAVKDTENTAPRADAETLAAGVIKASGWQGDGNFINPMCGSGTIAIEAADRTEDGSGSSQEKLWLSAPCFNNETGKP